MYMGKWEDSRKMETTMTLRHTLQNVQLKFLDDVIKKEVLDNLTLTIVKATEVSEKQKLTFFLNMYKWNP